MRYWSVASVLLAVFSLLQLSYYVHVTTHPLGTAGSNDAIYKTVALKESFSTERKSGQKVATTIARPRIAYLVVSHLAETNDEAGRDSGLARWEKGIFPALQYMVPEPDPIYVVMIRNYTSTFQSLLVSNDLFRNHSHRLKPIFVDCHAEEKTPRSLCCKQEQGLVNFHDLYYMHTDTGRPNYDWILYLDDDNYIRQKALQDYLPSFTQDEPIISSTDVTTGHYIGKFGAQLGASPYKCSTDPEWKIFWGQPLLYNQPAFHKMVHVGRLQGLVKQCVEFDVFHDVGNGLIHWMLGFRWLVLPGVNRKRKDKLKADLLSYHGIGRQPFNYTMQEVHEQFETLVSSDKASLQSNQHVWSRPRGYSNSTHFKKYKGPENWTDIWHTFRVRDRKSVV